jgi:hypothetical protein
MLLLDHVLGEIVNVTLTTSLYVVDNVPELPVNVTTNLSYNTGIWAKRNAKTVYYILSTDAIGFIRVSNDDMATDVNTYTFGQVIDFVYITVRNSILVWTGSKLYRSDNDAATFTEVQSDVVHPYNHHAVDSVANNVTWAEYGSDEYTNKRVFYSDDDGATFTTVLSIPYGVDTIRHFHTCVYNPYNQKWYVTSGDNDAQCRWFVSDGMEITSFTEIELPDSQLWRTVTMLFDFDGSVMWGSDSQSYSITGVFKANLSDLNINVDIQNDVIELFKTSGTVYTLEYIDGYYIVATYFDSDVSSSGDGEPSVFISTNKGESWSKVATWELKDTDDAAGGFKNTLMDYSNSRAYIRAYGDLKKHAEFWGNPYDLIINID